MKYWNEVICKKLSYENAKEYAKKFQPCYITREEWEGVHFFDSTGKYCILLKTGEVIINPEEIYDIDKDDWMVVVITCVAVREIEKYTIIIREDDEMWMSSTRDVLADDGKIIK